MFTDIDLRDAPQLGDGLRLPAQAIPTRKKDERWIKSCMDTLETIGTRQISVYRARFEDAYRIVDGSFQYSDAVNTSVFLSELDSLRAQSELSDDIEHYGFIEPIINTLIGEFLKQPNPSVVYTNDPDSTNEYLRHRRDLLWERVNKRIQAEIELRMLKAGLNPYMKEFESEEQKQQYMQGLEQFREQNIPKEVKDHMNSEYHPIYVEWAEKTLEEGQVRFDLDELFRDTFRDYLITGRAFIHFRIGHDYHRPERWSPLNTFTSTTQSERYPEISDYTGRIQALTPNQVMVNWGTHLNEKQKKSILRSKFYEPDEVSVSTPSNTQEWMEGFGGTRRRVPHKDHLAYENLGLIQDQLGVDLGYRGYFPNQGVGIQFYSNDLDNRHDLVRVTEAYWVSQKRVGYLTYRDPEGELKREIVTDEILTDFIREYKIKQLRTVSMEQSLKNPQENTIVWDYLPETRYGVKISRDNTDLDEDLYLFGDAVDYQLRGESSLFDTLIPVVGIVENTSLVSRLEVDQIEYSMAMNMARDYMSKELGLFFLMDLAYLPEFLKDFGGEEAIDKLMDITRSLGLMTVDSSQARGTQFNQFQMVNMDLTAAMIGKLEFAGRIKQRAFERLGLNPARMAMPIEQKTATGIQVSQDASFAQTEVWFDKFAKVQQRFNEMLINVSQWVKSQGKDVTVNYVDSDKIQHFLQINDPKLPIRRFKIYFQNNSKRRSELELLKQTFFNDNTIVKDLEMMAEAISSDSISKLIQVGRIAKKNTQLQQELQHRQAMQMEELKAAKEAEREAIKHQYNMEIKRLEGEIALGKQTILAMGFDPDKDRDSDKTPDVVEQLKATTAELERKFKERTGEQQMRQKQTDSDRNFLLKKEELNLKRQELATRREEKQKELQIAKENKYSYEV